jgi:two-component system, chemotaxis family, sensor kinase Cph1
MNEGVAPDGLAIGAADPPSGPDLATLYADALRANLADRSESALRRAYEIGRQGFAEGIGLLEMTLVHHEALTRVLKRPPKPAGLVDQLVRAGEFFAEALSPYEMAHRGFREAVCALRKLNETMEGEIQRIAHAVHDEAGQLLDAARLAISGVGHDVSPASRERLLQVGAMLDRAEVELRRLSHELRPIVLDDLGLVPALQALAEGISRRSGIRVLVESSLPARLPARIETTIYRVVQEAFTNVVRHSRARTAGVSLAQDASGHLSCVVRDDGEGFEVRAMTTRREQGGLGLLGIRERLNAVGGTLEIGSEPGKGTELLIEVPVET